MQNIPTSTSATPTSPMHGRISILSIIILLNGLSWSAVADSVLLTNGDRITGEITALDDKQLHIKPYYSPSITIARNAILSFETTNAQYWSVNRTIQNVSIRPSDKDGFVVIDNQQTPISELIYSNQINPPNWRYEGNIEAAIDITSNTTKTEKFHVKGDLTAESFEWRHNFKSEARYETEENTTKRNTVEGHYSLDYLISEHWLVRQEDYFQENKNNINIRNYYAALGPGYRFWGIGRDRLDFVLSYNRFWIDSELFTYQLNAWAATLNYKQYWFNGTLEAYADFQIAFPDIPSIDYISDSTIALKYLLTRQIYLSLKYDINETKSVVQHDKDISYTFALGINF